MKIIYDNIKTGERLVYVCQDLQIKDGVFYADCVVADSNNRQDVKTAAYSNLDEAKRKVHVWNKILKKSGRYSMPERINAQGVNGYLRIEYTKEGFVKIIDTRTRGNVHMHESVIRLIQKTIRANNKAKIQEVKP